MPAAKTKYGSDRQFANLLSTLTRLPVEEQDTAASFLYRSGRTTQWNQALPFVLENVQVSLLETAVCGNFVFPNPWSRDLTTELDEFERETCVLLRDVHLRGTDALYLLTQVEVERVHAFATWINHMKNPRMFLRARTNSRTMVMGWPFANFFK